MTDEPLAMQCGGAVNPHRGSWLHWAWKRIAPIEDEE